MPKSAKQFRGIVATGPTQQAAINQYKLLARGKNARVCVSGNDRFLASTSSDVAEMFDPTSGELGMTEDLNVIKSLSFAGEDAGTVEVAYTVCASGCGNHIVADDSSLVAHCPSCGVSVNFEDEVDEEPDLLADDVEDLEDEDELSESGDDEEGDDVIDVTDDDPDADIEGDDEEEEETSESDDEEDDADESEDEDSEDDADSDDEEGDDEEDSEEDADDEDDEDSEEDDSDEDQASESSDPLTVCAATKAEAIDLYAAHAAAVGVSVSGDGNTTAFYAVCSEPSCATHLVSESELHSCPICQSAVEEPEDEDDENVDDDIESALTDEDLDSSESEDLGVADDEEEEDDSEEGDDEEEEEDDSSESDAEDGDGDDEELDIDSAEDEVPEDASADDLDVSYSSSVAGKPAWTAFYKGSPVAVARSENAGVNADIFNDPKFGHATIAVARQTSVSKALSEMGFKGVQRKAAVSGAIKRHIDAQVATARVALSADKEKFEARFIDALSTSAMGISRNFFKDVTSNPLVEALVPALSAAGIVNPQAMVDRVISQSADNYHAVLFNKALDLLSKPAEVMDSLSSMVQSVNFQSTSSAPSLDQRVASFGTPVKKADKTSESSSQSVSQSASQIDFKDIVGTLGRR